VRQSDDVLRIENATFTTTDMLASNGLIHVIDGVLLSDKMLGGLAVMKSHKQGDMFAELIERNSDGVVASQLNALDESTIFVPINSAIQNYHKLDRTLTASELKRTLEGHIHSGRIELHKSSDDSTGLQMQRRMEITMLNGRTQLIKDQPLSDFFSLFGNNNPKTRIQCANVVRSNVEVCHGVIHYIDKVLVSPVQNLMELLRNRSELSKFVLLVEASRLDERLSSREFTGTVLAPTNEGIEKVISARSMETLLTDSQKVATFVKSHILQDQVCCSDLTTAGFPSRSRLTNMNGRSIFGFNTGGRRQIGYAKVDKCDLIGTNGIIHEIDRPIVNNRKSRIASLFENDDSDEAE